MSIIQLLMPNTSLLRLRQRLLYETLRERYFSTRGCANDAAQYKSVQVPNTLTSLSTSAQ
ncbi:MAG: hypothetical protein ACYT04_29685 [Nostoc sp.]